MCYALIYADGQNPGIGPDRVALEAGRNNGRAVWLPSARQVAPRFWRVGSRGEWRTSGDSLVITFSTPHIQSRVELRRAGGTLRGRAGGMSDAGLTWDWRPVEARRSPCPSSSASPAG